MAEVYLGLHNTLNRPVAVKILHGFLLEDDTSLARFRSEAQAVANMRHPNIVQVYDFDIADDRPYIVMELLEGPSLADYLNSFRKAGQTLPAEVTGRVITTVAGALDYAHSRGVIHRDVKPSNVLLRREEGSLDPKAPLPDDIQPVLTDFGVARMADTSIRTASGAIIGTPAYMSPEQVSGTKIDARSDIYSLGIMLYQMLTGRLPFGGDTSDTVASTLIKHITEMPPAMPEVSPAVQAVVFRALAKDPNGRYQKASDLAADLRVALGMPYTPGELAALNANRLMNGPTVALNKTAIRPAPTSSRARSRLTLGVAAAVAVIAAGAIILYAAFGGGDKKDSGSKGGDQSTPPEESYGLLGFADNAAVSDEITLQVEHLGQPSAGTQYQVTLRGGESSKNIGAFQVDADGNGELVYVDKSGTNLMTTYDQFEITMEPDPDPNPLPTGDVVYSGAVPPGPMAHVRHLLVSFSKAPDKIGLVVGIMNDAQIITDSAQALLDAQTAGDLEDMKLQAEGLVNLIEGQGGQEYGDLDGDGKVTDPSDGFGLLPGADSGGYIQTAINHAQFAAGAPDTTAYVVDQAGHLEVAAQNLGGWAAQLRDAALAILQSEDLASTDDSVEQITSVSLLFAHGQDLDGDGVIEPVASEGGADTVYFYAQRMADMIVLAGANRVPAPVSESAVTNTSNEEHY
jgi:hypothetical protein